MIFRGLRSVVGSCSLQYGQLGCVGGGVIYQHFGTGVTLVVMSVASTGQSQDPRRHKTRSRILTLFPATPSSIQWSIRGLRPLLGVGPPQQEGRAVYDFDVCMRV